MLSGLVLEAVDRCRDTSLAGYKCFTGEGIDRHNRSISEQSAKFYHISNVFSDDRNHTHCRCFLVDHTDRHLISDNTGDGRFACLARNGDHIKTDGAYTSHCFQFFQCQCTGFYRIDHTLVFADRDKGSA